MLIGKLRFAQLGVLDLAVGYKCQGAYKYRNDCSRCYTKRCPAAYALEFQQVLCKHAWALLFSARSEDGSAEPENPWFHVTRNL